MITKFYVPVLKTKQGEFDGLQLVSQSKRKHIAPLIEVTKLEFDNATGSKPKTIEKHLDAIVKRISSKWGNSNAFLDTALVNDTLPGGQNCVEYVYNALAKEKVIPVPTLQLSTPDEIIAAVKSVKQTFKVEECAIRIFIHNIVSPTLQQDLTALLDKCNVVFNSCHLILDLNSADFENTEDFSDAVIDHLRYFPEFKKWKSFSICGGSFPPTNRIKIGVNEVRRGEWAFFNKVVEKMKGQDFERHINYGDYGIIAPGHFSFDPLKMDRSANIRYTHNDIWYVIKGQSLKTKGHEQYFDLAKKILTSSFYLGEAFSEGDAYLKKCGLRQTSTGNPTVWNKVGFNHHFSKVIEDLSASYLAA